MKLINNLEARKERYLKDGVPVRLGGLAANLSRVKSFSANPNNRDAVFQLLEESKYFIEWTSRELNIDTLIRLSAIQRRVASWQLNWKYIWDDENERQIVVNDSAGWSAEIIKNSGLFDQ